MEEYAQGFIDRAADGLDVSVVVVAQDARTRAVLMVAFADREALRATLFEGGTFLHPEGTELGERYRLATRLAARFTRRLLGSAGRDEREALLRRFYRAGQTEKIRFATAA